MAENVWKPVMQRVTSSTQTWECDTFAARSHSLIISCH